MVVNPTLWLVYLTQQSFYNRQSWRIWGGCNSFFLKKILSAEVRGFVEVLKNQSKKYLCNETSWTT